MNITKEQYARIESYFPIQRGNVKIDNYTFINAILYIAENEGKWRALPEKYDKWNSICQRFKRWCENGVIQRFFVSYSKKDHCNQGGGAGVGQYFLQTAPRCTWALKNTDSNPSENQRVDGTPSFTRYPQMTKSLSRCTCPAKTVATPHKGEFQSNT